jgi:N-acetylglucosaminyldiphosphoundecaprenol N-acetyl-beta-D-mannosaminyltransferase
MSDHLGRLDVPVMIGVGAAFDFLSGRKPQAPRWMQRSGLEWLFRLGSEPRRLWPRYRQYPLFLILVAAQMLGLRKFPTTDESGG